MSESDLTPEQVEAERAWFEQLGRAFVEMMPHASHAHDCPVTIYERYTPLALRRKHRKDTADFKARMARIDAEIEAEAQAA